LLSVTTAQRSRSRFAVDCICCASEHGDVATGFAPSSGEATFPSGQFLIDDEVLTAAGITELSGYRYSQGDDDLQLDLFL
jgi:hypothetical protein